jgi:hypothetical protein
MWRPHAERAAILVRRARRFQHACMLQGARPAMRCLYCLERGASSDAVAICPTCGAAACIDHVVRAVVAVGITSERSADQDQRGPLRCHYCAGLLASPAQPSGTARRRAGSMWPAGPRVRLPTWRARREPALTRADGEAAVRAAERLLRTAGGERCDRPGLSHGRWRRWWLALSRRGQRASHPPDQPSPPANDPAGDA